MKWFKFRELLFIIFWWLVSVRLFMMIRVLSFVDSEMADMEAKVFTILRENMILATIAGFLIGLITGLIEVYSLPSFFKKLSMRMLIFVKSLVYILTILGVSIITGIVYSSVVHSSTFVEALKDVSVYISSYAFVSLFLSGLIISFGVTFVRIMMNKFGRGMFFPMLIGRYRNPKEENRAFMFLDLYSSTEYAERLGHINYSYFLQDCYQDLSDLTIEYNAEIYQFVGDEVVLTWKVSRQIDPADCINLFFAYKKLLIGREAYYENKYGIIPAFKASLNVGDVTVAEVGDAKTEIAFHGDVINTCARILQLCHQYSRDLLISESFRDLLGYKDELLIRYEGTENLRGKKAPERIYSVEESKADVLFRNKS